MTVPARIVGRLVAGEWVASKEMCFFLSINNSSDSCLLYNVWAKDNGITKWLKQWQLSVAIIAMNRAYNFHSTLYDFLHSFVLFFLLFLSIRFPIFHTSFVLSAIISMLLIFSFHDFWFFFFHSFFILLSCNLFVFYFIRHWILFSSSFFFSFVKIFELVLIIRINIFFSVLSEYSRKEHHYSRYIFQP